MNDPSDSSTPWLQRRFVPAAVALVSSTLAFWYLALALTSRTGATAVSAFGWVAVCAPPAFFGLLAGWGRPQAPVRHALLLSGIALLMVAPLFGEGLICVLMLSPVYMLLTSVVALLARAVERRLSRRTRLGVLLLPWMLFAAERPVPVGELPLQTISDSVVLSAPLGAVFAAIEHLDLRFDEADPTFTRWGLPVARAVHGQGAHVGAERRVVFNNGTVVARVTESQAPRRFVLKLTCENAGREFFDHWVVLEDTVFELEPVPTGGALLRHTTRYRRLIRPRPWFAQIERYGAHRLQAHLLAGFARQRIAIGAQPALALR